MTPSLRVAVSTLALGICLSGPAPAWAAHTILSGMFDGNEPKIDSIQGHACATGPLGFRQSAFRVSASGFYSLYDAFEQLQRDGAVWVSYRVYERSFNPAAPGQNVKSPTISGIYNLSAGIPYVLLVQHFCENLEGTWALAFVGPGTISSDHAVTVPGFTSGKFSARDPVKPNNPWSDGLAPYKQWGPIRVSRDGTYYFSDLLIDAQVSLQIYTAPVNPDDPWANFKDSAAIGSPLIELETGQDYYFVAQQIGLPGFGDFLYVLAPPAPMRINPGLAGSWHNPDTPGQGFFLTVFEDINEVFLAWFTFATESPEADSFGHRWLTAFGDFEGVSAELAIEWTTAGGFDSPFPVPEQNVEGTMQLDFSDCASGQITYGWDFDQSDSPAISGVIPIQRLANDSVTLCESLYEGPGKPGPL